MDVLHHGRPVRREEFICVIAENQRNGMCKLVRQVRTGEKRLVTHHRDLDEAQRIALRWAAGRFAQALDAEWTGDHWRPVWWQT